RIGARISPKHGHANENKGKTTHYHHNNDVYIPAPTAPTETVAEQPSTTPITKTVLVRDRAKLETNRGKRVYKTLLERNEVRKRSSQTDTVK
ncbi:hypothetical protein DPMN_058523, partial [Dreissena polymorpha]